MKSPDADDKFWRNLHVLQGFFVGLFAVSLLMATHQEAWVNYFGDRLYNWQTLIAGMIAVYAAMKTVEGVREQIARADEQIKQTERHERERIARRHRAARAELLPALVMLTDYTESCFAFIRRFPTTDPNNLDVPPKVAKMMPALPEPALDAIRRCLESADDECYDAMATLLSRIQIQHSRLSQLADDLVSPGRRPVTLQRLIHYTADTIEVRGRANEMWPYARREAQTIPKTLDQLSLVAISVGAEFFDNAAFNGLREILTDISIRSLRPE